MNTRFCITMLSITMFFARILSLEGLAQNVTEAKAPADTSQETDSVNSYLDAVRRIRSFDISAVTTTAELLTQSTSSTDSGESTFRTRGEEEKLAIEVKTRQTWTVDGRRRIDILRVSDSEILDARTFDGEVTRTFDAATRQGSVRVTEPSQFPFAPQGQRYESLYSEVFGGGTFEELFELRSTERMVRDEAGSLTILSVPERTKMYPEYGFKLVIDELHGGLPSEIETLRGKNLYSRTSITEFHLLDDKVTWVPVHSLCTFYGAVRLRDNPSERIVLPVRTVETVIDVVNSSWNREVDAERFKLVFPEGSRVKDDVEGVLFVAGHSEPDKQLKAVLAQAQNMRRAGEAPSDSRRKWQLVVIALNVLVIGGLAAASWRRWGQAG
jgi:hypothetical protein